MFQFFFYSYLCFISYKRFYVSLIFKYFFSVRYPIRDPIRDPNRGPIRDRVYDSSFVDAEKRNVTANLDMCTSHLSNQK